MHNNYYFLKQLSEYLNKQILGFRISSCFSQNKDELIIGLERNGHEFWIRADLKRQFSCLSFPSQFSRARKNSIDLFPEMVGRKISEIHQYQYERAFSLVLEGSYILLFKLFGNFSNVLLFENNICINVFKHGTGDENKIDIQTLDRKIDPLTSRGLISMDDLRSRFPSFDKNILTYLHSNGYDESIPYELKHKLIADTLTLLEHPHYYVQKVNDILKFTLLPGNIESKSFINPLEAINFFYSEYQSQYGLMKESKALIRILKTQLKKTENYIQKSKEKLNDLQRAGNYRQFGDIIMANLHNIKKGTGMAQLYDFYNNKKVFIKLNANLSPQKNAEQYYRKAKNQKIEIKTLEINIKSKIRQAEQIIKYMQDIEGIDKLKELRQFADRQGLLKKEDIKAEKPLRFKIYDHMGFQIFVGRNARNNDELTFDYGYKEDLWLHAKDVKGSHVLIKYQAGKKFPRPVIIVAAQLAAYHSANKNTDTCPVIHTPRKFVRKSKGMPAGTVIIDREEIIFVKPEDHL